MKGHVRQRGKSWSVVYDLGRIDGQRRQKWESGFRTRKLAEARLNEVMVALQRDEYVEPTKVTLGEYLTRTWLPSIEPVPGVDGRLKPSTWASYEAEVTNHVVPRIGHLPLRSVTAGHLDALYRELLVSGRLDGKGGLSSSTVAYIHRIIRKALHDAMRSGLVTRNAADMAQPPTKSRKVKIIWTADEAREFLTAMESDPHYPCFALVAATGMRRGEAAALRWSDLDLEAGTVAVHRNRVSVRYRVEEGTPKTEKSKRVITLDASTVSMLRAHRRAQQERLLANGFRLTDDHAIFCREDGSPYHPESISRAFTRRVKRLGLAPLPFHGLRDLHATLGLQAGVPAKVMSERLGHSSVAITLDVYTRVAQPLEQDAADRIAGLIYRSEAG